MTLLIFTLLASLSIGYLVFLCNKTDFILEYGNLLRLGKFLKASEYEEWKKVNELDYGYPVFIREKYSNFFSRLFGCPFCLITFISMGVSTFLWVWYCFAIGLAIGGLASLFFLLISFFYKKTFE